MVVDFAKSNNLNINLGPGTQEVYIRTMEEAPATTAYALAKATEQRNKVIGK
jgi:hypothetical protein